MSADKTMKAPRWNIENIFPGGSKSKEFASFRKKIDSDLDKAEQMLNGLGDKLDDENSPKWAAFILELQRLNDNINQAGSFAGCLSCADVNDSAAQSAEAENDVQYSRWSILRASLESFSKKQSDDDWKKFTERDDLKSIEFFLNEMRENAKLKSSEEKEKLILELGVNGYHAWNRLYDKMAGDLSVEIEKDGEKRTISLGQNAARMSEPDRETRRDAFLKMEKAWETQANLAAMVLDSQAGFRLSVYNQRNWDSALFEPLLASRMKKETIDAMWSAVTKGRTKLKDYIKAKMKLLNIDKFCWYDQHAPVGRSDRRFPYYEAADFIVEHINSFSTEMGEFTRMAIDKNWIEAEDRAGKAAGGWCSRIPLNKETRIFMTYTGNFSGLSTLAHELGHSYHGYVLKDEPSFVQKYPMNLAETASIFNELRVTDAAFNVSDDQDEKMMLLDQKLQNAFGYFCDLHTRYTFDINFYKERAKGVVGRERITEIMLEAQKETFMGLLDEEEGYHPLFWASKLHFYITGQPFYNFPYTFGFLFANGVYDRAVKAGPAFAKDYKALLADTGKMNTEDIASKHLGVDLTKEDFWTEAVARAVADVDDFVKLCG
jgi:pepF/M3 family oligoendopeptidase